jgi:hypothetical protein
MWKREQLKPNPPTTTERTGGEKMTTVKRAPIAGYRTMTGAQRYNARMDRLFDECKDAKTRFNASSRTETDDHDDGTCVHSTDTCPALAVAAVAPDAGEEWQREARIERDRIATILRNSAHANLSSATCELLANAIHATVVAPITSRDESRRLLVDALESILEWADPFALPNCNRNERDVEKAIAALAAVKGGSE